MLDPRRLRVTISLEGAPIQEYERDIAMSVRGTKYAAHIANVCEIRIANIDKPIRDKLLTEGTPYAWLDPLKNSVLIEAGRESIGLHQVYIGDITTVTVTQAPDIWLVIRSITGKQQKNETDTLSQNATTKFSVIANQVAKKLGVPLMFSAPDKDVANFSFSGSVDQMIAALGEVSYGVDAYFDDDRLVVKPRFDADTSEILEVNIRTGLVGIPEFVGYGVRCTILLTSEIHLGQRIRLSSQVYPAVDGDYVIFRLGFDLATRDSSFYYIVEAYNPNLGAISA